MRFSFNSLNRTLCDVLREMRALHETRNYSGLLGLIEEAQIMANRMEAALYDNKDTKHARELVSELKKEIQRLEATKKSLEDK